MADDDPVLRELLNQAFDPELDALWREGQRALAAAGLTVDDLLAELPRGARRGRARGLWRRIPR
ncbi:MAG TPA: hypothetical protein VID73_05030 [Ktedonobacterales bacterium]|jgi:hypothetical protein